MKIQDTSFTEIMGFFCQKDQETKEIYGQAAEAKAECAALNERLAALQLAKDGQQERLTSIIEQQRTEIASLKSQLQMVTIQNTALAIKDLFNLGIFQLSLDGMRLQLGALCSNGERAEALRMLMFAITTSSHPLDCEAKKILYGLLPEMPEATAASITNNYNSPISQQVNHADNVSH